MKCATSPRSILKCIGCRCRMPITNTKCPCCGLWPSVLECIMCGFHGAFWTNLLLTTRGPMHDTCWLWCDE